MRSFSVVSVVRTPESERIAFVAVFVVWKLEGFELARITVDG
jgi:hypothetical protein